MSSKFSSLSWYLSSKVLSAICVLGVVASFGSPLWAAPLNEPLPLQDWEIDGTLAALEDPYLEVKALALERMGRYRAADLEGVLKKPGELAEIAVSLMRDRAVDARVRQQATMALGRLGEAAKPYLPELVAMMNDTQLDPAVRAGAAQSIGSLGAVAAAHRDDYLRFLRNEKIAPEGRVLAAAYVGSVLNPTATELLAFLRDERVHAKVRTKAAEALPATSQLEAKSLLSFLGSSQVHSDVRRRAALAVGKAPNLTGAELLGFLRASAVDAGVRVQAAGALGDLKSQPNFLELLYLLGDGYVDGGVRIRIASSLGDLKTIQPGQIKDLLNLLRDSRVDAEVRGQAASALGASVEASEANVTEIRNFLRDQSVTPYVRGKAAAALGNLGDDASPYVQDIRDMLMNKGMFVDVRASAALALSKAGVAAQDYVPDILDFLSYSGVDVNARVTAAQSLENLGLAAQPFVPQMLDFLADGTVNLKVRQQAASAFGMWGPAIAPHVPEILKFLRDSAIDPLVRERVAAALGKLGEEAKPYGADIVALMVQDFEQSDRLSKARKAVPTGGDDAATPVQANAQIKEYQVLSEALLQMPKLALGDVLPILNAAYRSPTKMQEARFLTYLHSGGDPEVLRLLRWLGNPRPDSLPTQLTRDEARMTLDGFAKAWQASPGLKELRQDLAKQIDEIATRRGVKWTGADVLLLGTHAENLKEAGMRSVILDRQVEKLRVFAWLGILRTILIVHGAAWLGLVLAYPYFVKVRSIFFWNPWVRKIAGLGYVDWLLTRIPLLRRRFLPPQ